MNARVAVVLKKKREKRKKYKKWNKILSCYHKWINEYTCNSSLKFFCFFFYLLSSMTFLVRSWFHSCNFLSNRIVLLARKNKGTSEELPSESNRLKVWCCQFSMALSMTWWWCGNSRILFCSNVDSWSNSRNNFFNRTAFSRSDLVLHMSNVYNKRK